MTKLNEINLILGLCIILLLISCNSGEVGTPMVTEPTQAPISTPQPPAVPTPEPTLPPISTPQPPAVPTPEPTLPPIPTTQPSTPPQTNNSFRDQMLAAVNEARSQSRFCGSDFKPAVSPLEWNDLLEEAAQTHTQDMSDNGFFSHIGSDGSTPGDRLSNVGYDWSGYGENIALGYMSIEDVMSAWLDSPGHCSNIMNPFWKDMGAAEVNLYWTQMFATPK
jgi:uncharacterized protein YkwD